MPKVTLTSKPTMFFSKHQSNESWRLKEKIVAVIESGLQEQKDVLAFSSIKIKDIVNSPEEVDVLFTDIGDPTKNIAFVEVRNRRGNVGRPYIQEIMGKRTSLNINSCKIVSTKGFAPAAIKLAKAQGIPLRILTSAPKKSSVYWFRPGTFRIQQPRVHHEKCLITLSHETHKIVCELQGDKVAEKLLATSIDDKPPRLKSTIELFHNEILYKLDLDKKLFASIPKDGQLHGMHIVTIRFDKPNYYWLTNNLPKSFPNPNKLSAYAISMIEFHVRVGITITSAPIIETYSYKDGENNRIIAELLLATHKSSNSNRQFATLIRYNCNDETCTIGGAVFD